MRKLWSNQFLRFLFTGALNTVFGYCIYALITYVTEREFISIILANIVAVAFNFKTYGSFVFGSHDVSRIFRFTVSYIFIIGIQMLALKLLNLNNIANPYIAGAIITLPMALVSFFILKRFVFRGASTVTNEKERISGN